MLAARRAKNGMENYRGVNLVFKNVDSGNCRVYYTNGVTKKLYCFQESTQDGLFDLYSCSKDGEPDSEVRLDRANSVQLPLPTDSLSKDLYNFLKNRQG